MYYKYSICMMENHCFLAIVTILKFHSHCVISHCFLSIDVENSSKILLVQTTTSNPYSF